MYAGDCLRSIVETEIDRLSNSGLHLNVAEEKEGRVTLLRCRTGAKLGETEKDQYLYTCRIFLAMAGARYITGPVFDIWARNHLRRTCGWLNAYRLEPETVLSRFRKAVQGKGYTTQLMIRARIASYLEGHSDINLWGFANFRLRDVRDRVHAVVEKQVRDYLRQQDYKELVNLLRYLVQVQEPRLQAVNVVMREGDLCLLDGDGMIIETEYLDEFGWDEVEREDLLLSALITIAPEEVILHFTEEPAIVSTIREVFGDRVKTCGGCKLCRGEENRA